MYHTAVDAIVILDGFSKKSEATPKSVVDNCKKRLALFLKAAVKEKRR